ncbi:prolipoprotein diacylglyceryl transferase, partial [Candidatus Sumerlaeota bacterium]|nr:prolipoprotein diacylglyceryl transferase [Candidatus Sumerlaeota bacterium]
MHPVLLRLFGLDIAWYGVLIAAGVLVGVYVATRRAKTVNIAPEFIIDLIVYGVILGFVGSRVFLVLSDLRSFIENPLSYIFSRQGYVFFGGLITTAAFAIWYVKRHRQDAWQIADIMSPSLAIGQAFGRVGCFMSGCCYGRICQKGWEFIGVSFPVCIDHKTGAPSQSFNFAYWDQLARGLIEQNASQSLPMFPVQL